MANSTVCQSKWKPIAEPRRAKPKSYREASTHWLKFYEDSVIESEAWTAVARHKRLCKVCHLQMVEDEYNVLLVFPALADLRRQFYRHTVAGGQAETSL